ncbi:hypothetical protein JX265_006608 [Neoarthrinium moseri]|uniref:Uncharacterized protein n=1 Tax=Neoarthrinium moseri TaxID=1658444 RepID=A0A9P9WM14_9PEZI|nr:hypothetical protein JX265_006608 [Neoarthrinium moseri]
MRSAFVVAAAAALAVAAPTANEDPARVRRAKPEQIRSVSDPIYHYYLQRYPKDPTIAVMGPVASSEYFNIGGSIQSTNSSAFLNIGADTTSYKTLTFGTAASTTAWALEGDTIITGTSSSWGRQDMVRRLADLAWAHLRTQLPGLPARWQLLAGLPTDRQRHAERQDV